MEISGEYRAPRRVSLGRASVAVAASGVVAAPSFYAHYKQAIGEQVADLPGWTDAVFQETAAHLTFGTLVGVGVAYAATQAVRLYRSVEGAAVAAGAATGLNIAILELGREGSLSGDWKADTFVAGLGAVGAKLFIEPADDPTLL